MSKMIVSYDGSSNDDDAVALGRILAGAGADVELAYVRHSSQTSDDVEALAERDADQLLERGARSIGNPDAARHVIVNASTPDGLKDLAAKENADVVVFGSDYRTAAGSVQPQASAQRLFNGGPAAVAIAPAGLSKSDSAKIGTIGVISEDGDTAARETATSLAKALGAEVVEAGQSADLLVVGSSPSTQEGRLGLSAATEYAIGTANKPVIAVTRGKAVSFGSGVLSKAAKALRGA